MKILLVIVLGILFILLTSCFHIKRDVYLVGDAFDDESNTQHYCIMYTNLFGNQVYEWVEDDFPITHKHWNIVIKGK